MSSLKHNFSIVFKNKNNDKPPLTLTDSVELFQDTIMMMQKQNENYTKTQEKKEKDKSVESTKKQVKNIKKIN